MLEPNFRSLGGQINAGRGSAGGRGSLCKGLELGQGQKRAENRESKQPPPPCPSLAVQWLRNCLPVQAMWVRFLAGELRSHIPGGS